MIRISAAHDIFSWVYNDYKSFLAVETDDILMETDNRIWFESLAQTFDTLFNYTFQEVSKIKILYINIIQRKYGISMDQTDHIMKISFNNIGKQKQKMKLNFSNHHFQQIPHLNKQYS